MIGIHTYDLDINEHIIRLKENGFVDIGYTSNEGAKYIYDSIEEMVKHIYSMHCSKDYSLEEHLKELEELIETNRFEGQLSWPEHRYIWRARKE